MRDHTGKAQQMVEVNRIQADGSQLQVIALFAVLLVDHYLPL